jgi:uncharacterized protein YbjT (DUF2867 family)
MKLVTIYGGSGFLGRHIARRMAQAGWRVRVAVRRPVEAGFVRTYGTVGQVEPVLCNIRDDASVASAMSGADAVVNTIGILAESGRNSFEAVQHDGPERVARLAAAAGIGRVVQISAIGADADSDSDYARTKGLGEAAVLDHVPGAVILRPSILFGSGDSFFNRFAGMTRFGPVLPVVGGDTLFQPVHVDDVAAAAELAVLGRVAGGVYELGGPDVESLRALMQRMLGVIRRRRLIVNIPFWLARIKAGVFEFGGKLSLGLAPVPFTRDQVVNLGRDNVVSEGAKTLVDLGIAATSMDAVLEDYLWRFRPSGQYAEITESAKNLRIGEP